MGLERLEKYTTRFKKRVVLPGALVILVTAGANVLGLHSAASSTDDLSLDAQKAEVWRALGRGMDELSVAQESLGLCASCRSEAAKPHPDVSILHGDVAQRLFQLAGAHETYILDSADRAILASLEGRQASLDSYARISNAATYLVDLARGRAMRPSGRSNLNERLPGAPPEPLLIPALSSGGPAVTALPTVQTSAGTTHATDLVRIGDRVAIISAMCMTYRACGAAEGVGASPLLVSVRYLDDAFLQDVSQRNFVVDPRLVVSGTLHEGEATVPVMNSDGKPIAHFAWKPLLGGKELFNRLAPSAALVFAVVVLLVVLMALRMRQMMKKDDERVGELEHAHIELKAKEAQAHHLAYHDALTGLPNRALFNDTAEQALIRARHGEPAAILLLDLDGFKKVNDRFGHLAGDALIQQVAERLTEVLQRSDTIARLGGDEFAILLRGDELEQPIDDLLERILAAIRQPYNVAGNQAHVGVSIGVAMAPLCGTDRTELMRKADIALYRAKGEGRDCYRFFNDSMDESVQIRALLETDLRLAMDTGSGLVVHYQPLIDAQGREVSGLEALLRWRHPTRGWIPPHLFVPVAEETGLISVLGEMVLGDACRVAKEWPQLTVAINLSPVQFCDNGFAERVCTIVRRAGVDPRQIELEVTEGIVLDQSDEVRGMLHRLRAEGFRIALDDFGTGYSSLAYLRDLDVDKIKIDKSFIQGLGLTAEAESIVTAVVTLGHAMGLQVTAEGVETRDQEDFLRAAGCNLLQGFRFSHAVPAEALHRKLKNEKFRRAA